MKVLFSLKEVVKVFVFSQGGDSLCFLSRRWRRSFFSLKDVMKVFVFSQGGGEGLPLN